MKHASSTVRLFLIGLFFVAMLLACDLGGGSKPTTVITAPPSGSTYHEGDDVAVQSTSADANGVTRIELSVDGAVVRNDTPPTPQTNFSIIQTWKATQGTHTLTVRAYNAAGTASDPAAISVQVSPSVSLNNVTPTATTVSVPGVPTGTSVPPPTSAPPPPTTSAPPAPSACTNNSAFVTDVSVPDGTNYSAGQTFNKIWRMSNIGTCAWGSGYQLVFISGEAMTSSTLVSVPATAPGATADILVPMTAPSASGDHTGSWRMRSADGAIFGQTVTVKITVPGAPPPPASGCSGNPVIASFTASSTTITVGSSTTLNWGAVTNADSVEIDHGIGGVPAPGSTNVSPGSTTTYKMTAHCGTNTTTAQVTITVNPALPAPVAVVYDLIDKANLASWSSGAGSLTFGGADNNPDGFVLWRNNNKLNDGSTPPRVLETHPNWVAGGHIDGTFTDIFYSGYTVQASDHISGKVGFLYGASAGNVTFKVMIRPQGGTNTWIVTIPLAYANGVKSFNYSLAAYAGKKADFILRVEAGSSSSQDWAAWQNVEIIR